MPLLLVLVQIVLLDGGHDRCSSSYHMGRLTRRTVLQLMYSAELLNSQGDSWNHAQPYPAPCGALQVETSCMLASCPELLCFTHPWLDYALPS